MMLDNFLHTTVIGNWTTINQFLIQVRVNYSFFLNYIKTHWFTNIYYHLKSINIIPSKINITESKSKFNDSSTLEYIG